MYRTKIFLLICVLVIGCATTPMTPEQQTVWQVLKAYEKAFGEENIPAIMNLLSSDGRIMLGGVMVPRQQVPDRLPARFVATGKFKLIYPNVHIEGDEAKVRCNILGSEVLVYFTMVKKEGRWLIKEYKY